MGPALRILKDMNRPQVAIPGFICDDNLGKLARFLRLLGVDTLFFREISDGEIISRALSEGRTIITRHRKLHELAGPECSFLVDSTVPEEQLATVLRAFGITESEWSPFSRCLECNTELVPVEKESTRDRIPPYVYSTQDEFNTCPSCGKIFWKGTHVQAMNRRIQFFAEKLREESTD